MLLWERRRWRVRALNVRRRMAQAPKGYAGVRYVNMCTHTIVRGLVSTPNSQKKTEGPRSTPGAPRAEEYGAEARRHDADGACLLRAAGESDDWDRPNKSLQLTRQPSARFALTPRKRLYCRRTAHGR